MSPDINTPSNKTLSTLAARCALAGAVLTVEPRTDGGPCYIVELRGRIRQIETVTQVDDLLNLIEGDQ